MAHGLQRVRLQQLFRKYSAVNSHYIVNFIFNQHSGVPWYPALLVFLLVYFGSKKIQIALKKIEKYKLPWGKTDCNKKQI